MKLTSGARKRERQQVVLDRLLAKPKHKERELAEIETLRKRIGA